MRLDQELLRQSEEVEQKQKELLRRSEEVEQQLIQLNKRAEEMIQHLKRDLNMCQELSNDDPISHTAND